MLEGITVLNQEMIMCTPGWANVAMIVCLIGMFVFLVVCLISNNACITISFGIATIACLLFLMFGPAVISDVPTGRYRYEVTIDESVSFNDIYERYEIVEQRGDIWVLEEKEE